MHITKTMNTDRFLFVKGKLRFEELQNGKIQCGGCKEEYTRIIGHLNKNNNCSKNIDINEFKAYWTKFSGRKRVNKCYQKNKEENKEQFLNDQAYRKRKSDLDQKRRTQTSFLKNNQIERENVFKKKRRKI